MNKERFLEEIREAPDDAPRLVFADWLEEQGASERADFIRAQCALHANDLTEQARATLRKREQELLGRHGWSWAEEAGYGEEIKAWSFERGFIERVELAPNFTAERIQEVMRKHPARGFRVAREPNAALNAFVEALPFLDQVTGLEFWSVRATKRTQEQIETLLHSPRLRRLESLVLDHCANSELTDERLIARGLRSPHRAEIRELAVNIGAGWKGPSNLVLQAIADAPHLRNLRKLHLCGAGNPTGTVPRLQMEFVQQLAASANLANLEELDLRLVRATEEAWRALASLAELPHLRKIYLCGGCVSGGDYLREIARWKTAFDQLPAEVDWDTLELNSSASGFWRGISWEDRRRQLLRDMHPFIRDRDHDGLESRYRAACREFANEAEATAVGQLSFGRWEADVRELLPEVLEIAANRSGDAVVLRIRPDEAWRTELCAYLRYDTDSAKYHRYPYSNLYPAINSHEPFDESGIVLDDPLVRRTVSPFMEAADLFRAGEQRQGTRPNGPGLYVLARTIATVGRILQGLKIPCRVFLECQSFVFPMA